MSLTHNAGPLQLTSGQSTAGGTVKHDSERVTFHGVPEHKRLNEVLQPSRGNPEQFVSPAKTAECKILPRSHSPIILPSTLRRLTERQRLMVHQKKKGSSFMMDATRYRSILFFRDIDKTERTFLMKARKQKERQRQKSVATKSHEKVKVKGTQLCGKKDDLLIEGSKVSPGRPFGSSRNRTIS
jgi:hypothetical protein